jgi:ribosomal protein L11 methyltransferase
MLTVAGGKVAGPIYKRSTFPATFNPSPMDTIELVIPIEDARHEALIARLEEYGFTGFQEGDGVLKAYIGADDWSLGKSNYVKSWLQRQGVEDPVGEQRIAEQNWNAQWEQSIQPLTVGPFVVKPTWAAVPDDAEGRHVLEIDPKMSFGTGYHESTRLMLRFLPDLIRGHERVLDAGTGTGILAIAAVHLGVKSVIAFDISTWAEENARENSALNAVADRIDVRQGAIDDVVPERGFDLILANIERDPLIDLLPAFADKLADDGRVVLAGLTQDDEPPMRAALTEHGFVIEREARENEWWAVVLHRLAEA